jgi:hypothetical protein
MAFTLQDRHVIHEFIVSCDAARLHHAVSTDHTHDTVARAERMCMWDESEWANGNAMAIARQGFIYCPV